MPGARRALRDTLVYANRIIDDYVTPAVEAGDPLAAPPVFTEACYGKYGKCDFYEVCRSGKLGKKAG